MQLEIAEFYESVNDALQAAVVALGGFKKVGPALRPELPQDQAAQWLRDCLNPVRRENLRPEQLLLLIREARKAGWHSLMNYVAADAGYRATPVDAEQQQRDLQETIAAGVEQLNRQMAALARLNQSANLR